MHWFSSNSVWDSFLARKSTSEWSFLNQKTEYDKLLLEADPFRVFREHRFPKNKAKGRLGRSERSSWQVGTWEVVCVLLPCAVWLGLTSLSVFAHPLRSYPACSQRSPCRRSRALRPISTGCSHSGRGRPHTPETHTVLSDLLSGPWWECLGRLDIIIIIIFLI